jgi:hypothetical protein
VIANGNAKARLFPNEVPPFGGRTAIIGEEVVMKVEVALSPDIGAVLQERAKAEGLSLDQFAARTLEAVAWVNISAAKTTPEERVRAFDEFLAGFESNVALPEEAFDRENWYPDRW